VPKQNTLATKDQTYFYKNNLMSQPSYQVQDSAYYQYLNLKRLLVWLADTVVITALTFLLCLRTFGIGFFFFLSIWAIVSFLYGFMKLTVRSATLGMPIVGVPLRAAQNRPLDELYALLHNLESLICFSTRLKITSVILMPSPRANRVWLF
jgi:uncharacterized RDD family membrane protein YckC